MLPVLESYTRGCNRLLIRHLRLNSLMSLPNLTLWLAGQQAAQHAVISVYVPGSWHLMDKCPGDLKRWKNGGRKKSRAVYASSNRARRCLTITLDLQRTCLNPPVTRLPMGGLLAHPVSLPRSVPIPHFIQHRAHLECDSWRPLSDDIQFWFGLRSGKMTTHNSQGNGRASPPLALASRVPGNSETEISGHGIAPLLHRALVLPMSTQHVGMLASICFLSRHSNTTLKRHSAAAAILYGTAH